MHILVGIDGSEAGTRALDFALRLVREQGAQLTAVHVRQEPPYSAFTELLTGLSSVEARRALSAHADQTAAEAEKRAAAAGVSLPVLKLQGQPAAVLLEEAQARQADLILVGTHGYKGMDRVLLGSVAEGLLRHSDRPVLVVPPAPHPAG